MKVMVVHPAQQHSYRLAAALKKQGFLYKYVTTVYCKSGSFTKAAACLLRGNLRKKAFARSCEELEDSDVVQFCEGEGLLKLLTMHLPGLKRFYRKVKYHTADRFAKKAARYAIRHQVDAVVGYDDSSSLLFETLEKQAPEILRILDMSAANILYMKEIYEKDIELQPHFAARLKGERQVVWDRETRLRAKQELQYAQIFLTPSHFVEKSLKASGILEQQIKICPYGVDPERFSVKTYRDPEEISETPVRFIYVGGVKELKGISYLLEAIQNLPESRAQLTVVGQVQTSDPDLLPFLERIQFTGPVLHEKVAELLQEADVFVFPSLGEGWSLAVLEAASCGLPLILSEHSGVNDAVTDGREGFVVPIQSTEALTEKMRWFTEHPDQIEPMGRAAREMALGYTWERYEKRVAKIFGEELTASG